MPTDSAGVGVKPLLDYSPPKRRRLKSNEIKYLVFEGGGGKGFAYLGALRALQECKVLQYTEPVRSEPPTADGQRHAKLDFRRLRGVGGASAGAITAFLLSIGYTPKELATLMAKKEKFIAFFDGGYNDPDDVTKKRLSPVLGGPYAYIDDSANEIRTKKRLGYAETFAGLEAKLLQLESTLGLLPEWVAASISKFKDVINKHNHISPFDQLIPHWKDFAVNFKRDWGLFAGASARDFFDQLLAARMPPGNNGPQRNITFEAHFQHFNVELLVTGTNLLTGKSQVFSHIDTPWMPVADAVRISMGIPFVFKPVVVRHDAQIVSIHPELQGCWVDGGVLNNTPFREFDDRPGDNPKTLALRLEIDPPPKDMTSVTDFFAKYLKLGMLGPGEAYITAAHAFQTVVLATDGLDLLDFGPRDDVVNLVSYGAAEKVFDYFTGLPSDPSYGPT